MFLTYSRSLLLYDKLIKKIKRKGKLKTKRDEDDDDEEWHRNKKWSHFIKSEIGCNSQRTLLHTCDYV